MKSWKIGVGLLVVAAVAVPIEFIVAPAVKRRGMERKRAEARLILKQIGVYLTLYESKYGGYPPNLEALKRPGMIEEARLLACPGCGTPWGGPIRDVYAVWKPGEPMPDLPLAWCDACLARDGESPVLFFQGRVDAYAKDKLPVRTPK
ncbi:MAG: hypothetical protein HYY18_11485 [Planctomycetes bacterium]|nr:hypothetical protein [Planctomycetota bacterium]